jgi:hypothetical protein
MTETKEKILNIKGSSKYQDDRNHKPRRTETPKERNKRLPKRYSKRRP